MNKIELIFATHNKHKLNEIIEILSDNVKIISLNDIKFNDEIAETANSLLGNAMQKAIFINEKFNLNCFADDTGLEVEALNGEPGIYSARYAGDKCSYDDNINKLLSNMKNCKNRNAEFKTVIALIYNNNKFYFEGGIKGKIIEEKRGISGFGYDPIFIPNGYTTTFAEMSAHEKNKISHRALATKKFADFIKSLTH